MQLKAWGRDCFQNIQGTCFPSDHPFPSWADNRWRGEGKSPSPTHPNTHSPSQLHRCSDVWRWHWCPFFPWFLHLLPKPGHLSSQSSTYKTVQLSSFYQQIATHSYQDLMLTILINVEQVHTHTHHTILVASPILTELQSKEVGGKKH